MSDETPRELTEPEMQTIERGMTFMDGTTTLISARELTALLHMARRGARAALAARLTDERLLKAIDAYAAQPDRPTTTGELEAMRRVLLDALTGTGEDQ